MKNKSSLTTGKPSKRELDVLLFISKFQKKRGYSPSLAEIAEQLDIKVPTVHQHVASLRMKKLLTAHKGKRRSIQALHDYRHQMATIPLMGLIPAGGPIEAIRDPEPLEIPRSMLSHGADHYALKVTGRSMVEENILDGDIVIIRSQPTVENGEKAVAYLPDRNEVTLKKIYWEESRVKLVPANRTMKPFYEDNVEIQGKVIGILRKEV